MVHQLQIFQGETPVERWGKRLIFGGSKAGNRRLGDALWLQLGGNNLGLRKEMLNLSLVGRSADDADYDPKLEAIRRWGFHC